MWVPPHFVMTLKTFSDDDDDNDDDDNKHIKFMQWIVKMDMIIKRKKEKTK